MIRRAFLVALAMLGLAPSAGAEPAGVEQRTSSLSWVRLPGAEECVGTRALAEAVEARLGRRVVASAAEADMSIEGRVERLDDGGAARWRATVVASDAGGAILGERVLDSAELACSALDATLALVIAVMIDPEAELPEEGTAAPEPVEEPEADEEAPDVDAPDGGTEAVEEPAAPVPPPTLRVDLTGAYVVAVGTLPGVPMGPALSVVVDPVGFWPLELELSALLGAVAEGHVGEARLDQIRAGIFVCAPWDLGVVRLDGCGGLVAGATRAEGTGFDRPHVSWSALVEGVARIRVLYNPISRLVLRAEASLLVPVLRDRVVYLDAEGVEQTLFEPAPVGGAFDLGVGVLFE